MSLALPLADRLAPLARVPPHYLLIHEIYASVQGESTFAGRPCVFVRTTGCSLRCRWCFVPDTPVLMADWSWRPIGEVRPGDEVVAFTLPDEPFQHHRLTVATVREALVREAATAVVNGTVRCTPEHKFWLTGRDASGSSVARSGWREVARGVGQKALFLTDPRATDPAEYERGWLAGMADGDGCFWTLKYRRGYRRFRLAQKNPALLERFARFAGRAGVPMRAGVHAHTGFAGSGRMACLWLTSDAACRRFEGWLAEDREGDDWRWGYLGGMIDAEGSLSGRVLRVAQHHAVHPATSSRLRRVLDGLGLPYTVEPEGFYLHRSRGGLWRVLANARPAKESVLRAALRSHPRHHRVIESVIPTGQIEPVVTLSTTAGSYIAAGYVVRNCDTPHAFTRGEPLPIDDVSRRALAFDIPLVEITGGEPLEQPGVLPLMTTLCDAGKTVLLETSGAIDISNVDRRVHIIMDLKCPDSGEEARNRWANLDHLKPTDEIKFVLASRRDWDWTVDVIRRHRLDERFVCLVSAVFGTLKLDELAGWLVAARLADVRMQLQMHKYIWEPTARGV